MSSASGNQNYIFYPAPSSQNYQTGKVTLIVDETIAGTDGVTKTSEFDLQFNYFSKSGRWWQIVIEPGTEPGFYPNMFQLWRVDVQAQKYLTSMFSIGEWPSFLYEKGTQVSLSWSAREFEMYSAFLSIRNPQGISNQWQINFSDFTNTQEDLTLNTITDRTLPGACMSVFSITGSDNGSKFTATSGKGRIIYEGLVPDPTGAMGIQTAESSNFNYSTLIADSFGNHTQSFSL